MHFPKMVCQQLSHFSDMLKLDSVTTWAQLTSRKFDFSTVVRQEESHYHLHQRQPQQVSAFLLCGDFPKLSSSKEQFKFYAMNLHRRYTPNWVKRGLRKWILTFCLSIWTDNPRIITSTYSSGLTPSSPQYLRPKGQRASYYYYEIIEISVRTPGMYYFKGSSLMDTYGYMYLTTFNPANPSVNIWSEDNDGTDNRQFRFGINFVSSYTLTLVVTTFNPRVTGAYTVISIGPAAVTFVRKSSSVPPPATSTTTVSTRISTTTQRTATCTTTVTGSVCYLHSLCPRR